MSLVPDYKTGSIQGIIDAPLPSTPMQNIFKSTRTTIRAPNVTVVRPCGQPATEESALTLAKTFQDLVHDDVQDQILQLVRERMSDGHGWLDDVR